jgi:hypothetical protein
MPDAINSQLFMIEHLTTLMRYRDENGQRWADLIDFLTMYPDARRRVVRLLGEMEAESA